MAAPGTVARKQVASLRYLQWQDLYTKEKPFQVFAEVPEASTERYSNLVFSESPPLDIQDITGHESEFTLDQNGFIARAITFPDLKMETEQQMKCDVLPIFEEIVKREVEGADFVLCFDWGFRKNAPAPPDASGRMNVNDKMHVLSPGRQVHCDQSAAGAINRLAAHAPEMVDKAEKGRLRIINVWKPLHHTVQDNTLAVCDGQTILPTELVEADHISRTYLGNTMYGLYSPKHKWYYIHHQRPDDVLFIKIFDSDPYVAAKCSLHVSFDYENVPGNSLPRESLELRFLVITF